MTDLVNHPEHYKGNKFECIDIVEHYNLTFCLGTVNVMIVANIVQTGGVI